MSSDIQARFDPHPRLHYEPFVSARRLATALYFGLLVSPALIPLLWPYLPFQDWPGHVGILGVMTHWGLPGTEFYTPRSPLGPNRLFYLLAWPIAELASPLLAARLVLAVSLGALAPSAHFLLRALGREPRFALAVVPLALGRHLTSGFATSAPALVTLLLALAFLIRVRRNARPLDAAGLALSLLVTGGFHAFIFCVALGFVALGLGATVVSGESKAARLIVLSALPTVALAALLRLVSSGAGAAGDTLHAVMKALRRPSVALGPTAWEWTFASLRYTRWDDALQAVWCGGLALTLVMVRSARTRETSHRLGGGAETRCRARNSTRVGWAPGYSPRSSCS